MGAKEKIGITKMGIVIVIAAIIIIAAVATAGWWFFLRPVEKKTSTIDLALFSDVPNGENQIVSGLIKPPVADATVTLIFTKPDGSTFNVTVTSGADGLFTYTYTVDIEGNWTVTASWPGNNEFKAAESTLKTFTVVEALAPGTSLIRCFVLPSEVERGGNVTVTGQIWPAAAGAGVTVTLNFTMPDGSTFTRTVTSVSDGSFTYTYTSLSGDLIGWWDITASWPGTAEIAGDVSDIANFHILPVLDKVHPIKFGVIGPMEWIQGVGMKEGAQLAADQINEAGGILGRKVVIVTGDEGSVPERGTAEMERLCSVEKVHFVLGGFRTEIVYPMREKAMDYRIPFSICGAATPWLIDCFTTTTGPHAYPCGACVRCDYDRYKYLFRVMPTNTDVLFSNFLVPYIRDHLIPHVIQPALVEAGKLDDSVTEGEPGYDEAYPGYPEKLNVSVIVEALDWTAELRDKLDRIGPLFFGPWQSRIVSKVGGSYYYSASPLSKDFTPQLAEMKARGTHIIFHVFAGEEGLSFIKQWSDIKFAVPIGVNVMSQMSEMWGLTGGGCEYETELATMGTSTPVAGNVTVKFWDDYVSRWGHAPVYTAFGAYEAVMGTKETVEKAALDHPELNDPAEWETLYGNRDLYDILIPYMENMDRLGVLGRSKFTRTHDVYTGGWLAVDKGVENYVKPLAVQWQSPGRMAAVSAGDGSHNASAYHINEHLWYDGSTPPAWAPYIEKFQIPPWMLE